jgi:catechol 2,3-dioxygenase-like lactoylglutathione lyase family enzyme
VNDELERLVTLYDGGQLSRRQLLKGLIALGVGTKLVTTRHGALAAGAQRDSLFRAHTINHVTIQTADVSRSKAFYQSLTGLPVRAEDKDFCEFRLERGFLGLYGLEAGDRAGFDHFCFGVDDYNPQRAFATLKSAVPEAEPTLVGGEQVYLRDPDGVRVQLADVNYKR